MIKIDVPHLKELVLQVSYHHRYRSFHPEKIDFPAPFLPDQISLINDEEDRPV